MTKRLIEPIASEEQLRECATEEDLAVVALFSAEQRRREVLAWRAVVRRELGGDVKIGYDTFGAPVVDRVDTHIGVSHSKDMVAVVISDTPCAIDIEDATRNFERVIERVTTPVERALSSVSDWSARLWCAKEALYKYHRKGELDFRKDIEILGCDDCAHELEARLTEGQRVKVEIEREGNHIIATIV